MNKKISFEQAMESLEEIVLKLENGGESLEDSLKLFEEGTHLSAYCCDVLKKAEQKVTTFSLSEEESC